MKNIMYLSARARGFGKRTYMLLTLPQLQNINVNYNYIGRHNICVNINNAYAFRYGIRMQLGIGCVNTFARPKHTQLQLQAMDGYLFYSRTIVYEPDNQEYQKEIPNNSNNNNSNYNNNNNKNIKPSNNIYKSKNNNYNVNSKSKHKNKRQSRQKSKLKNGCNIITNIKYTDKKYKFIQQGIKTVKQEIRKRSESFQHVQKHHRRKGSDSAQFFIDDSIYDAPESVIEYYQEYPGIMVKMAPAIYDAYMRLVVAAYGKDEIGSPEQQLVKDALFHLQMIR